MYSSSTVMHNNVHLFVIDIPICILNSVSHFVVHCRIVEHIFDNKKERLFSVTSPGDNLPQGSKVIEYETCLPLSYSSCCCLLKLNIFPKDGWLNEIYH